MAGQTRFSLEYHAWAGEGFPENRVNLCSGTSYWPGVFKKDCACGSGILLFTQATLRVGYPFFWQDLYQACPDDHSQGNDRNNNDTGEKAVFTNVAKSI